MNRNGMLELWEALVAKAQSFVGLKKKIAAVRGPFYAPTERESARRLALLGGTEPDLGLTTRRRPEST